MWEGGSTQQLPWPLPLFSVLLPLLQARPERNIVVVSHGVFLETLLNRSSLYCADDPLRLKRFENAEMRSVVVGGWQ